MNKVIPITPERKEFLMTESKTFCMLPWLHVFVSPSGEAFPCCTTDRSLVLGNVKNNTMEEIFNNDVTKQLRLDMLNEVQSDCCKLCYDRETISPHTYRTFGKEYFGDKFDETVAKTNEDGSVDEFKMRLLDIRFSNICNFACRTCGSDFSSKWGAEQKKLGLQDWVTIHADDHTGKLLEEVQQHLDHTSVLYFAGGEPLIMDEHYVILEEMIRRGRTDVLLRYNTNGSSINYKDKDLLDLWKNFNKIDIQASVDHYGERAEYIRHGTDWGVVESNLIKFRELPNVNFGVATVLSVFNYLTITDFYKYMLDKNLIRQEDHQTYLSMTTHPTFYSATALPKQLKEYGTYIVKQYAPTLQQGHVVKQYLDLAMSFVHSTDTWNRNRREFLYHTKERDLVRGESFIKVFPELEMMVEGPLTPEEAKDAKRLELMAKINSSRK
jgi:organic radical activating enzyme